MEKEQIFGLYDSAPVWPAEREVPAVDGRVFLTPLTEREASNPRQARLRFADEYQAFVEALPRPHTLALHLGVSCHAMSEHAALQAFSLDPYPSPGLGGVQAVMPGTCLLDPGAVVDVLKAVRISCDTLKRFPKVKREQTTEGRVLLRISAHAFHEDMSEALDAYLAAARTELPPTRLRQREVTPVPGEEPSPAPIAPPHPAPVA